MKTDQLTPSLKEKIEQIGTGLFTNLSESVIKLPASIVSNLVADDYGYVWFITKKSYEERENFEGEFPAKLNLFRKQVHFFMEVEGEARIVSDPEEIFTIRTFIEPVVRPMKTDAVLVKMKVLKIFYHEPRTAKPFFGINPMIKFLAWLGIYYNRSKRSFFPSSR